MAWFPYGLLLTAIAVAALAVLALMLLSLWRKTKTLMGAVATANETVAASTEALERAQATSARPAAPPAAQHAKDTRRSPVRRR